MSHDATCKLWGYKTTTKTTVLQVHSYYLKHDRFDVVVVVVLVQKFFCSVYSTGSLLGLGATFSLHLLVAFLLCPEVWRTKKDTVSYPFVSFIAWKRTHRNGNSGWWQLLSISRTILFFHRFWLLSFTISPIYNRTNFFDGCQTATKKKKRCSIRFDSIHYCCCLFYVKTLATCFYLSLDCIEKISMTHAAYCVIHKSWRNELKSYVMLILWPVNISLKIFFCRISSLSITWLNSDLTREISCGSKKKRK